MADREARGPFQSLAGLDRVSGVGPKLLAVLEPYLAFSGRRPPGEARPPARGPVDLNAATAAELEELPGVGPALAGRIVSYRESHGRFADIGGLDAVPGIGPGLAERLKPHLTVR